MGGPKSVETVGPGPYYWFRTYTELAADSDLKGSLCAYLQKHEWQFRGHLWQPAGPVPTRKIEEVIQLPPHVKTKKGGRPKGKAPSMSSVEVVHPLGYVWFQSRAAAADHMGLSQQQVSNYINGDKSSALVDVVFRASNAGVRIGQVFGAGCDHSFRESLDVFAGH